MGTNDPPRKAGFLKGLSRLDKPRLFRWLLVLVAYLAVFSILDQLTQKLELYPAVVAWYPPDGLSLAFLLTFGVGFAPVFALASLISSISIFQLSAIGQALIWAVVLSAIYGVAVVLLRRRARIDPQLKELRDTLWLIFSSLVVATVLSLIAISTFVNYGTVPRSQYFPAFAQWWIGEMIGILAFTPFLLLHVMPWVKRFIEAGWAAIKPDIRFRRPSLLSLGQAVSIPVALYLAFGLPALKNFQPLYLISLPLIWIALQNGFSSVTLANVVMNIGTILAIWIFKFDPARLGELQFLMFGIYASTLLTGAVVTKQKRTEAELRRREVRNQALIENAPDAIILLGADGLLKYLSPSTHRILGYSPEQWLGADPAELTHPDDLPGLAKLLDELGEKPGNVVTAQYRLRHSDGSWRWLESTITNLLAEPSVEAMVINFRDITERKQAEAALRESERGFRALVEHSLEEISLVTPEGNLIYESPTARRPLGYPPDTFVGKSLFELFHPDDRAAAASLFEKVISRPGSVEDALFRLRHLDGSWRWLEGIMTNMLDEPAVRSIVINYRDVTERMLAEAERNQSEALFRALFELSPDSIVLLDPHDPAVSWPIIDCNRAACEINGYTRDELIGQSIDILNITPGSEAERTAYLQRLQEAGNLHYEVIHCHKDGSTFPVEVSTALFSVNGRELVLGIDRDITLRKQVEDALRESEHIFRGFLEQSEDAIMLADNQGILIQWSKGAEQITGYSREESLGQMLWDVQFRSAAAEFKSAEHYENMKAALQKALVTGKGKFLRTLTEAVVQRKDGTRLMTQTLAFPVLTDKGYLLGSILRDITERKNAEDQVKLRTDELSMLFELSHSLAEADSLHEILDLVVRHAVQSVHTTFAGIALLEEGKYVMRAFHPVRLLDHDSRIGVRTPLGSLPFLNGVLDRDLPTVIRSADLNIGEAERKLLYLDVAQTLCLIPLGVGKSSQMSANMLGALLLGEARSEGREPFSPEKMRLAQSIGDLAAIAIRRVLLRGQTERRLQQFIALSEIGQAIISSSDLGVSLKVLLMRTTDQLGVDAADIWQLNPAARMLEFVTGFGFHSPAFEHPKPLHLGEGHAGLAALERRTISIPDLAGYARSPRLEKALASEPFVSYYAVPLIAKGQVKGVMELFHRTGLETNEDWLKYLNALASQAAIAIDNSTLFLDLEQSNVDLTQAYDATIRGWSRALDLRDKETEGHTQRVTELTVELGSQFHLSDEELVHIRRGALLHDIGKMGVPDQILLKPGALTDEEWVIMRKHPTFAYEMLSPIQYLRSALDIPYCHHEKWDGTGYPRGLKGEQIPLAARIFAVVDVWDALTSDRPYRAAWSEEKTLAHISSLAGSHFDPQVVQTCLESGLLKKLGEENPG